jgi:epoxyqueuosine reductase
VDADSLHRGNTIGVTTDELQEVAHELGLDAIGVTAAEPYAETERHIRERRARGLFADMRFTMAQPETSCHPETLLPGARSVVSAALCYYEAGPAPSTGEGRLPRYTWRDHYALLRERLDALGRRLGGRYRVLVDANQHVDREAAARSGVGFYGKNTMLITRRHGSWVVLGTLVTDVELETTPRWNADCGSCRLCIDACPTDALDEPGTLEYREELGASVYGCDICQDVCPWNRGVEKRHSGVPPDAEAEPVVSLVEWLESKDDELSRRYDRLYVPRNDGKWLKRNALVAAGNTGGDRERAALAPYLSTDDEVLREHAEWADARIAERS